MIKKIHINNDDNYATPPELYEELNKRFNFDYTQKQLYEVYRGDYKNIDEQVEWEYFLQFVGDHPELKPYRTEWMIYDEDLKLAGSIDMVYENADGTLSIYDWKFQR